ncbi:MAG: hypothetical protein M3406_12125 [Chloroflexota bacterium]|nr:hypothetical protein [Chloroflexota bacterium]
MAEGAKAVVPAGNQVRVDAPELSEGTVRARYTSAVVILGTYPISVPSTSVSA